MLQHSGVPGKYWTYAIETANYLRNRTTIYEGTNTILEESLLGGKPDLAHLRVFGCRVWVTRNTLSVEGEGSGRGYDGLRHTQRQHVIQDFTSN